MLEEILLLLLLLLLIPKDLGGLEQLAATFLSCEKRTNLLSFFQWKT